MRDTFKMAVAAGALLAATQLAHAQNADPATAPGAAGPGAMDKLEDFKSTGAKSIPTIPQDPAKAADIEKTLAHIKLPPGFKISLYAQVPDARMIAVGPQGVVTFVSTRKDKIYALTDRTRSGHATEVKEFAPTVEFKNPNGICLSKDGFLYTVEQNRVLQFAAAEFFYESPDVAVNPIVKQGDLIPASEESFNHSARVCVVGPDNKLYIAVGQPYNVYAPSKQDMYYKAGMGAIIRMNQDGSEREIYAHGLRNSVGLDFAKDKTLWFTDNQVDGMGDDIPPGELNHVTKMGQNFGFPWYGGGHTRTVEYKDQTPPADLVFPVVEEAAHAADLGMMVYTGKMFPKEYQGAIFSAQHGSWNRTVPVGARVMVTKIKDDGTAPEGSKPFAEGWLNGDGEYDGRPVAVAQLRDGSLLVSDDFAGAVYRITYSAN
ncbi:PQQ-dependent sugar dehydrogenase [Lichenifustis flavocetrariae]|uniref:PQQ-dependent sugar dehydrogenase n=1 Tax=Lichenifustis flavocetrariae TaxID=2949735 RepID=A0AA41YSJ1_9HYPH|nr:PQQ-dependent sugar dehydrogenase [Lichenifustis flavocetrariae]MCW6507784.1 PQQ-dependent sugar dehydrogenase [Lichenifustis flavocetrariae]